MFLQRYNIFSRWWYRTSRFCQLINLKKAQFGYLFYRNAIFLYRQTYKFRFFLYKFARLKPMTMKRIKLWMQTAILVTCGLVTVNICLISCKGTHTQGDNSVKQVQSTELIRTSQSWDGVELPDYFQGRPELVAVKYEFPAGQKLGWHHHPVMNYGVLVQGELTIIGQDGKEKVVHEGEAVVEMVNTIHHGENRGTKPVILYMFYLSQKDLPLAVQHPEIPLE